MLKWIDRHPAVWYIPFFMIATWPVFFVWPLVWLFVAIQQYCNEWSPDQKWPECLNG